LTLLIAFNAMTRLGAYAESSNRPLL